VTIERREDRGKTTIVTTACGLCGAKLRERKGMAEHLPNCPAREIFAEPRVLRDGGPDPDRVRAAIENSENAPAVAADGGEVIDE